MDSAVVARIAEDVELALKPYRAITAVLPPATDDSEWSISISIPTGIADRKSGDREQSNALLWPIPGYMALSLDDEAGIGRIVKLLTRSAIISLMVPEVIWNV